MMKYGIIAALLFAALVAVADANAEDGAGLCLNFLERFNVRLEYEQLDFNVDGSKAL